MTPGSSFRPLYPQLPSARLPPSSAVWSPHGKGALGAVVATLVVILFMGLGLYVLQRTAKSLPHLFQAMGLLLYTAQILLLFIFVAAFKNTSLFNPKSFALTLVVTTLVWIGAQARAHMKAKILYVEPDSSKAEKPENKGHSS